MQNMQGRSEEECCGLRRTPLGVWAMQQSKSWGTLPILESKTFLFDVRIWKLSEF